MEKTKKENKTHTLRFAKANVDTWNHIKDGKKKVETRAATVKYLPIKVGDTLILSCDGKKFEKKVKRKTHFKTLTALFKKYPPDIIYPGIGTIEKMIAQYHSFPSYEEKIKEHGIIALELE